jgi:siroheme synthase
VTATPTTVQLVGIGPGDPLLLTRRAADRLGAADVVVADRRSAEPTLALAPAGAERVFVGLADGQPAWPLDRIVELVEGHARAGRRVVRVKSGDPFVCSRGGEEADALRARGLAVEVTPGVTAATAAPLVAGLPFGDAAFVASGDDDPDAVPVDWDRLADPTATLVVLTGRAHQGRIVKALVAAGRSPDDRATVVRAATRAEQAWVACDLEGFGAVRLPPPAAFVVHPSGTGGRRAHP